MTRRTAWLLAATVALVLAAGAAFVLLQDPDRYRDEVAGLLGDAAGHPVTLDGPLELSWRPSPMLSVSAVSVDTPAARVRADAVQVHVEPGALLARRLRARDVRVSGVVVDLASASATQSATGRAATGRAIVLPDPADLAVDELTLDGVVLRRDGEVLSRVTRAVFTEPDSARGARVDLALPVPGGELRGRLRLRVTASGFALDDLALDTPVGPVDGRVSVDLAAPRTRITGELSADAVTLRSPPRTGGRVFTRHAADLSPLRAADMTLRLRIGRLNLNALRLSDITLPLSLVDGRLEGNATASLAGGVVNAVFALDAAAARWTLDAEIGGADAGDALGMLGVTNAENGGRLEVIADLSATGSDTGSILASLSGHVHADSEGLRVRAGTARLAASDVPATVARVLRGADGERITVECAVARFTLRDGVASADGSLAVQTRSTNVIGGGRVSLPDERLELVFRPWPREGIGPSASTVVGVVGVSGALADPRVGLTSESALRGGATAGGLLPIAQGLMARARGDAPCQQAAGVAVVPPRRGARETVERAVGPVGDTVKAVGSAPNTLFRGSGDSGDRRTEQ